MRPYRLIDIVLVLALKRELGCTLAEMQKAVYNMRYKLVLEQQPLASRLMRHPRLNEWLDLMIEEYTK